MTFDLLTSDLGAILGLLTPETQALWGRMTPQNMVEHLSGTMRISNGKVALQGEVTPERRERGMAFLMGPDPMPRDVRNPALPPEPPPHRFPDIATAVDRLLREVEDFHAYWASSPADLPWHPRFGPLNHQEWIRFHNKHITHHLSQFGLV